MRTIITPIGDFQVDELQASIEEIKLEGNAFTDELTRDMSHTTSQLLAKTINLSKAIFIRAEDLNTMLGEYDADVLIFYRTTAQHQQATTFTVISADDSMDVVLTKKKWKLTTLMKHSWALGGAIAPSYAEVNTPVVNINNLLLKINYNHEYETAADFEKRLHANSTTLLTRIEEGKLPALRIAVVLKKDLAVFADPAKYKGVMLFLNYTAHKRVIEDERFSSSRFVSLTLVGVVEQAGKWGLSTNQNGDNLTLSVVCPPDCPTYNDN